MNAEETIKAIELTEEESCVLSLLGRAWNAFASLDIIHEADRGEFIHAIHTAQNIILSRPTLRYNVLIAELTEEAPQET